MPEWTLPMISLYHISIRQTHHGLNDQEFMLWGNMTIKWYVTRLWCNTVELNLFSHFHLNLLKIFERARKVLQLLITSLVSANFSFNFQNLKVFIFHPFLMHLFCKMVISRVVGKQFAFLFRKGVYFLSDCDVLFSLNWLGWNLFVI